MRIVDSTVANTFRAEALLWVLVGFILGSLAEFFIEGVPFLLSLFS